MPGSSGRPSGSAAPALTFGIGRSFLEGPESFANWSFDLESPFERQRTLDPAADPVLVERGLVRLGDHYPALKGLKVAYAWGGLIDSTPDGIPVISAVDPLPGLFLSTGYTGHGFGIGPRRGPAGRRPHRRRPADRRSHAVPLQPHDRRHRPRCAGDDVGRSAALFIVILSEEGAG